MKAGAEAESVILRETVLCQRFLSGHLEKWRFEPRGALHPHFLGTMGAAGSMAEESLLEIKRKDKKIFSIND